MTDKIIKGSGGGGGRTPTSTPQPSRAPDTLNSEQFASHSRLIIRRRD